MENKFFRPAENLIDKTNAESKFFRPISDLSEDKSDLIYPKADTPEVTPFRNPGDIEDSYFRSAGDLGGVQTEDKYFKPARDLNEINNEKTEKINNNKEIINKMNNNIDKINDYLLTVVSGKKYDGVCELGVLTGSGRTIVGLEQLMQMVDEGYNIVSAKVINTNMIEVEFQKYVYNEELMERRSRF